MRARVGVRVRVVGREVRAERVSYRVRGVRAERVSYGGRGVRAERVNYGVRGVRGETHPSPNPHSSYSEGPLRMEAPIGVEYVSRMDVLMEYVVVQLDRSVTALGAS